MTITVTGGAVSLVLDASPDAPSSPLRSEALSVDLAERDVMTEVGSWAEARSGVVCSEPGQAAVVYTGAMMQELDAPSETS